MTEQQTVKHTPGPWITNGKSNAGYRIDSLGEPTRVGLDMLMHPVAIVPELPDARLIAAAPELLEALEAMVDDIGHEMEAANADYRPWLMARAAIAKATGAA